eukprot:Awhi_evm1s7420
MFLSKPPSPSLFLYFVEWITFGEKAKEFTNHTIKIGQFKYLFAPTNKNNSANEEGYDLFNFDDVTTYLLYRPIKNLFFSVMQFAGLLCTVEHHQKGFSQPHRYIYLQDK